MQQLNDDDRIIMQIVLKLAQLGHEVKWQPPVTHGPLITTYRFAPSQSTKISQIISCADDLTLALGADQDVMIRRLPGEAVLGISVPNKTRTPVLWRDTLTPPDPAFQIPLNMGTDSQGKLFRDDLATLPHLLVAGSTGSGKSTWMGAAINSLLWWRTPQQLKICLSDTKGVEFPMFDGSPHEFAPRAQSKYQTWEMLDGLADEMDRRMALFQRSGCRNIAECNTLSMRRHGAPALTYIVMFIDELATVLEGDKRGESKIAQSKIGRIVQLSRAAGVHIVASTQRPSVDVVIGSVKNNFPARLSFRVSSGVDSRTVIGMEGAEHLINRGDMLYLSPNQAGVKRLHAAIASQEDLQQCCVAARARLLITQPALRASERIN